MREPLEPPRGRAVFVDRDGTLNAMIYDETHGLLDSPRRPEQVQPIPGAAGFLAGVKHLGFRAVVVTNQPGIAKGTLSLAQLDAVNGRLAEALAAEGAAWDELRACPHHPQLGQDCECRKPRPGLLVQAARDLGLDLAGSWMVGDGLNDVAAGRAAGCRTILVTRLKIEQIERFVALSTEPDFVVPDLAGALRIITDHR